MDIIKTDETLDDFSELEELAEVSEEDVQEAIALFNHQFPEYMGILEAEIGE